MAIKICLDAGHYGKYNRSPCDKDYYESVTMFKLVEYLKEELFTYKDVHVKATRKSIDENPSLYSRGKMAKGYDLFISEHSNAVAKGINEDVDYVVVYRSFDNKNNADELGLKLANAVADVMGTKQDPRTNIRKSEKADREYYGVLRGADDAGCPLFYIVENSFHTNSRSTEWLLKDNNLKKLAQAQAKTIADYYGLSKKISIPSNTITPDSPKEDIKWAQDRLNRVLPDWYPKLSVDGSYGPKTRIAVLIYWDSIGWAKHMNDDGKRIGQATREALRDGRSNSHAS